MTSTPPVRLQRREPPRVSYVFKATRVASSARAVRILRGAQRQPVVLPARGVLRVARVHVLGQHPRRLLQPAPVPELLLHHGLTPRALHVLRLQLHVQHAWHREPAGDRSYGYNHNGESIIHAYRCRFQTRLRDHPVHGVTTTSTAAPDNRRRVRVEDCLLDGFVRLDIQGVHDGYGYLTITPISMSTSSTTPYTPDVPMLLRFRGEMYSYYDFVEMTLVYKNVTHTSQAPRRPCTSR